MNLIATIAKELFGLFVDDGSLALGILALVLLVAGAIALGLPAVLTGPMIFIGCAALLVENVRRTLRARR